jgi:hypothetical protein
MVKEFVAFPIAQKVVVDMEPRLKVAEGPPPPVPAVPMKVISLPAVAN